MSTAATPAIAVLLAAGVDHDVVSFARGRRAGHFGAEAVAALADRGVAAAAVLKTLVVNTPSGLAVAVLPVPATLSLKATAAALGVARASMADAAAAQRSSGYVLGGISPLGQRRRLPTVVDDAALRCDRILVSAGRRGMEVALAPTDLIRLTEAVTASIAAS